MKRRSTGSSSPAEDRPTRPRRAAAAPPRDARAFEHRVPSDPAIVERVLDALEVEPSRRMGQNFLIDPFVADREAALLDLPAGAAVLEIGGGLGQLTRALLARGYRVTVVEKERRFAAFLEHTFGRRIRVIDGDARSVSLPRVEAAAGNLPFVVAQEVLQRLVAHGIARGAFLVQKEVAERLASPPGHREYGRPTVLFRVDGVFELAGTVPSHAFHPAPKVDGALLLWRRDPLDPAPRDRRVLERLVELAFQQRRKMLGGTLPAALARGFRLASAPQVLPWIEEGGWPPGWAKARPEEIPPEAYVGLANVLVEHGASAAGPGTSSGSAARSG